MSIGRNWPQGGAFHIVDPVNTTLAANVFTGSPANNPQYLAVGVVEWSASAVVATQDSADGLIGGSTAPSYGIQLGFLSSGTFVAVSATNPLPTSGGGGGGGGTQYAEGNTTSPATGTVALYRKTSNSDLFAAQLDDSLNLKVAVENSVETIPGAPTTSLYLQAPISFSASGANTVVAGSSGKTIRVYRIFFVNADGSTTTQITIKDSTPTNFSGAFPLIPAGSFSGDGDGDPLFITASGKDFVINSSAAVQISGTVWYTIS